MSGHEKEHAHEGHDKHDKSHGKHDAHHGPEKKKMGFVRRLLSIVTLTSLSFFVYNEISQPLVLDPIEKNVSSGLGFNDSGSSSGAASKGHAHH